MGGGRSYTRIVGGAEEKLRDSEDGKILIGRLKDGSVICSACIEWLFCRCFERSQRRPWYRIYICGAFSSEDESGQYLLWTNVSTTTMKQEDT